MPCSWLGGRVALERTLCSNSGTNDAENEGRGVVSWRALSPSRQPSPFHTSSTPIKQGFGTNFKLVAKRGVPETIQPHSPFHMSISFQNTGIIAVLSRQRKPRLKSLGSNCTLSSGRLTLKPHSQLPSRENKLGQSCYKPMSCHKYFRRTHRRNILPQNATYSFG